MRQTNEGVVVVGVCAQKNKIWCKSAVTLSCCLVICYMSQFGCCWYLGEVSQPHLCILAISLSETSLLSLSDAGVHVGEPVFDAGPTKGGREESRWTEGRGGGEGWEFKGFPLTHTHTHKHTCPHPHLAASLLPSSLLSAGMSAWGLRTREAGLEDHRIGNGIGGLGQDWIIIVLLETSD